MCLFKHISGLWFIIPTRLVLAIAKHICLAIIAFYLFIIPFLTFYFWLIELTVSKQYQPSVISIGLYHSKNYLSTL